MKVRVWEYESESVRVCMSEKEREEEGGVSEEGRRRGEREMLGGREKR